MKFYFTGAEHLSDGLREVLPELSIECTNEALADIAVSVTETDENIVTVTLDETRAEIVYGGGKARFFRGLATLAGWVREGKRHMTRTEKPLFSTNGAMVDMSRNAVMNLTTVKSMMRKMALMGMNMYMLYTEDTYEIEGYPYFGYMRGRYTKKEIRELDAYALSLGIELIPCIQVLGHLATMLRWESAKPLADTSGALLVDSDETYELIDAMLRTVSECFTSRRIHLGMDETHDLGTGKFLDRFGYEERYKIFLRHLSRVSEMAHSYGFSPMMWSDMFFRLSAKGMKGYSDYDMRTVISPEIAALAPKDVQQVFWDYYHPNEEFYTANIEKHKLLGENIAFAGGVWFWSGHAPLFSRSLRNTPPALEACRKGGIREVIATVWHNGGESCLILSLAGLAWYADYDYTGSYDEDRVRCTFRNACMAEYDDFLLNELPAMPQLDEGCATRELLYNDPLIGLMDKHFEGLDLRSYFEDVCKALESKVCGEYAPAFEVTYRLADLLASKADFGIRLKAAYDAGNRVVLGAMAEECDTITEKITALKNAHLAAWMTYNKAFGWEVMDARYGILSSRFATAKLRILAYLAGEVSEIEELSAERLRFDGASTEQRVTKRALWYTSSAILSAGAQR